MGHGRFKKTGKNLILTDEVKLDPDGGSPKEYFSGTKKFVRNRLKWKNEQECLVNCTGIGQEFILNTHDNPSVIDWASHLINQYGRY